MGVVLRGYCQVKACAENLVYVYLRHTPLMRTSHYHRRRFPAEIIGHRVWLYFRFALSFRDVDEMLAVRGVALTLRQSRMMP